MSHNLSKLSWAIQLSNTTEQYNWALQLSNTTEQYNWAIQLSNTTEHYNSANQAEGDTSSVNGALMLPFAAIVSCAEHIKLSGTPAASMTHLCCHLLPLCCVLSITSWVGYQQRQCSCYVLPFAAIVLGAEHCKLSGTPAASMTHFAAICCHCVGCWALQAEWDTSSVNAAATCCHLFVPWAAAATASTFFVIKRSKRRESRLAQNEQCNAWNLKVALRSFLM